MRKKSILFFVITTVILLSGCVTAKHSLNHATKLSSLKFLDEYIIPHNLHYENTWVGGLSGIDYDKENDRYFIISDERSATSPSRFYTAKIQINSNKIDTVFFTAVSSMLQPDGKPFPSLKTDPVNAADPESLRYNPVKKNLVWSSEGDRAIRDGKMNIKDPFIYEMDLKGNFLNSFFIPKELRMTTTESGPRVNGVFEGTSFDAGAEYLYVSVEEPLYEDGPRADVGYKAAPVRILKFDAHTRKPVAQYAYLLDAVAYPAIPADAFRVNGISEIYWINNNQMLVMERSYSTGRPGCTIKLFLADISLATDVSTLTGLHQRKDYKPITKKLLLNMDDLGRYIDNVEGITFGPILANGNKSLILIADNNFQKDEKNQVFLFEVIP